MLLWGQLVTDFWTNGARIHRGSWRFYTPKSPVFEAISYARVSTTESAQDGTSLAAQTQAIRVCKA